MMKRIFVSLFTVIMVLGLMSVATSAAAADEPTPGATFADGTTKTWSQLVADGDIRMGYEGYDGYEDCLTYVSPSIKRIVIDGESVRTIDGAFYDNTTIESIIINEGVVAIGNKALYVNPNEQADGSYLISKLSEVVLPESLETIGFGAFVNSALTEVTIYADKTYAVRENNGQGSHYSSCPSLKKVIIEDGVTTIPSRMFESCYELEQVIIPASVTSIGDKAFYDCLSLKSIVILGDELTLGNQVFDKNNIYTDYGNCDVSINAVNKEVAETVSEALGGNGKNNTTSIKAVAMIDGKGFETMEDAMFEAEDGDTITILPGEHSLTGLITKVQDLHNYPYADNLEIVGMDGASFKITPDEYHCTNGNSTYQFGIGGSWYCSSGAISFENIDFVFEDTKTDDTHTVAEFQVYTQSMSFTNCKFNGIGVCPWGPNQNAQGVCTDASFNNCTFENINGRNGIHQSRAEELTVDGCTFKNCSNGIHINSPTVSEVTITNNTFENINSANPLITIGEKGDYSDATIVITGNENNGDNAIANLSYNQSLTLKTFEEILAKGDNEFGNASSSTFVALIGDKGHTSLAEAIESLKDNDTLTILAGTHEIGAVKLPTPLDNVTIQGAPDKVAIIKNSTIMASDGGSVSYTKLTFDGIVFDNSNLVLGGSRSEVTYKDITIKNCEFKNIVNEGRLSAIHMHVNSPTETVENFTFTNNIIDGISGSSNSGVYISAVKGTVTIENNVIKNVAWNAIQIKNSTADTELFIEGNTFENAQATGEDGIVNLFGIVGDVRVADNTMTESFPGQLFFCYVGESLTENGFVYGGTFYGSDATLKNYVAKSCGLFEMAPGEYAVAANTTITVTFDGFESFNVPAGTVLSEYIPDNDGYELVGWYTDEDLVSKYDFSRPFIVDTTLYPCWKDDKHDVDTGYVMIIMKMLKKLDISVEIIEAEGGKIVVVVPEKVKYNKSAVCTVIPDEGYTVKDVIVDGESVGAATEYTIEKLKGKHTITAVFEKLTDTDANGQ